MKMLQLKSDTIFYGITGAPGLEIKQPSDTHNKRCFVQCTSQGSRYLSKGMIILYKVILSYYFLVSRDEPHVLSRLYIGTLYYFG